MINRSGWHRPVIMGTEAMVSSGHHLASLAAIDILKKGGNAVDAGVAMGLCLNVTIPEMANFGGVAPIMFYSASEDKVITISGLGKWPKAVSIELIKKRGGLIYDQFTCSIVPSAPDAWITALDMFGTMPFGKVAEAAIHLAKNGFPAHSCFINNLVQLPIPGYGDAFQLRAYEYARRVFFPSGHIPRMGDLIIQTDLAKTLQRLVLSEEKNLRLGRHGALMAVRDEFYKGEIAKELVAYVQGDGGFLS